MTPGTAIHVMIVDDHRMVAQSMLRLLDEQQDISVVAVAHTVSEAMEASARQPVHVALMDYRLPDGDGVTASRRLLALQPTARILILTGHPDERLLRAAIDVGCSGLLSKTAAATDLVGAVRLAAAGESVVPQEMLHGLVTGSTRRSLLGELTARELEILGLLAEGYSNNAIADRLGLTSNTVRNHVQRVITKLGAHSRHEAVAAGVRAGLVPPPI